MLHPNGRPVHRGIKTFYVAAGATGTLTATLSPTAATGTAVSGTLGVIDQSDPAAAEPALGFPLFSDFHDFGYAYTVG